MALSMLGTGVLQQASSHALVACNASRTMGLVRGRASAANTVKLAKLAIKRPRT
jgi:hypothetical protein